MTTITRNCEGIGGQSHSFFDSLPGYVQKTACKFAIVFESIYYMPTMVAGAIRWQSDKRAGHMTSYDLTSEKTNRVGQLYLHGSIGSSEREGAVVFLHGDYGHPAAYYHLIQDALKNTSKAIFSMHLPYNDSTPPEEQCALLEKGINKMEHLFAERGGVLKYLTMVGHSKGAIESAHYAFHRLPQEENPSIVIDKVISIAGRLKCVPSEWGPCHPSLEPTLNEAYQGILKHPEVALYQIFGDRDSNAPAEAMAIRPGEDQCFPQKGEGHLSIVFSAKTRDVLKTLLM